MATQTADARARGYRERLLLVLLAWLAMVLVFMAAEWLFPGRMRLPCGFTLFQFVQIVAGVLAVSNILALVTLKYVVGAGKPPVEGVMVGRVWRLLALLALLLIVAYALGSLRAFGALFAMFGGMLLGWSLQAPVSGFAAWILVSVKRPFRPGDRIQFPSLALVGDVIDMGAMYTVLDQVGGGVGSEEAIGRHILIPNAMLFSQVVINYTVKQEAAYMLDEVIVRMTYDSHWDTAEKIMLEAANNVTGDIIAATGIKPYIRSDLYDYGVYMRLRYQTRVKDRVEIAYNITKTIFQDIQKTEAVDLAIPFIYSYRAGADRKEEPGLTPILGLPPRDRGYPMFSEMEIGSIEPPAEQADAGEVERLATSIASNGLLQPIVVVKMPHSDKYEILAGHLRYEACRRLGWKMIPAIVREEGAPTAQGGA